MTAEYNPPVSESWMSDALCAQTDPTIFFPEKGASSAPALSVCAECTVIAACELFADRQGTPYGVLAGKTAFARRKARAAA